LRGNPTLNRNSAIYVPITRTSDGSREIGYINAGFRLIDLKTNYKDKPRVNSERSFFAFPEFEESDYVIPTLVHKEVRIPINSGFNSSVLRDRLGSRFSMSDLDNLVSELEKS